jgi:hypothetical protein
VTASIVETLIRALGERADVPPVGNR